MNSLLWKNLLKSCVPFFNSLTIKLVRGQKMYRYISYRIYPSKKQREAIQKTLRCCDLVWNLALRQTKRNKEKGIPLPNERQMVAKIQDWIEDYPDILDQNPYVLTSIISDFYKALSTKKALRFRKGRSAYRLLSGPDGALVTFDFIEIPGLGYVRYRQGQRPDGFGKRIIVKKTHDNKYYAMVLLSIANPNHKNNGGVIGIDLGIKDFLVTSEGNRIAPPNFMERRQRDIRLLNHQLDRRNKRSKNYRKTVHSIQKLHEKIKRKRKDFLIKTALGIVKDNAVVCIESLDIKDINRVHSIARREVDLAWGEFVDWLQKKAVEYGTRIVRVGKYFPSSQLCSNCGRKNPMLRDYTIKTWKCPSCGVILDRDINAAINIRNEGIRLLETIR